VIIRNRHIEIVKFSCAVGGGRCILGFRLLHWYRRRDCLDFFFLSARQTVVASVWNCNFRLIFKFIKKQNVYLIYSFTITLELCRRILDGILFSCTCCTLICIQILCCIPLSSLWYLRSTVYGSSLLPSLFLLLRGCLVAPAKV
jgi:hypothetical protein